MDGSITNKTLRKISVLISLSLVIFAANYSLGNNLTFSESQKSAYKELIDNLEKRHYSKSPYNQELASLHLTRYLEKLDPGKLYFSKTDIDVFSLKDTIKINILDSSQSIEIFNTFAACKNANW